MLVLLAFKHRLKISDLEKYLTEYHLVFPWDIAFIVDIENKLKKQFPKEKKEISLLINRLLDARDAGHTGDKSTKTIIKKSS